MSNLRSLILPVGILAVGIAVAVMVFKTTPKPQKKAPVERVRLVEAVPLQASVQRPYWKAGGTVIPYQQLDLQAQVSGQVMKINPQAQPGAILKKGAILASIDPRDYEFALAQAEATWIQAKADLAIEEGQVALAKEEFELSGSQLSAADRALVLREPQIAAAKAKLKSALAAYEKAKLDLQRTSIRMPFDGQILKRHLSLGAQVNTSTPLFGVVDTERYWLEVKVPQSFLPWIDQTQPVEIQNPIAWQGETRKGSILNILPDVDSADRQIKVMVNIDNPLALDSAQKPVLLNDFVEVTVWGRDLQNIYQLESGHLDSEHRIWVVSRDNELQRRQVKVVYAGREKVWGHVEIKEGDRLLESRLTVASPGMKVKVEDEAGMAANMEASGAPQ